MVNTTTQCTMFTQQLMNLGLPKNEAQIYEALIEHGVLSVAELSKITKIHRRNIYDCLNRMQEKGFAVIILEKKENRYKAANPEKLNEIVEEKKITLESILPGLQKLWSEKPHTEEVYVLKGVEGYKSYMTEILKSGEDLYAIGAGGLWANPKVVNFINNFREEFIKKGLKAYVLYDHSVEGQDKVLLNFFGKTYKFMDKKFSSNATMDIFGDYVAITTKGKFAEIKDATITIIKNRNIADAFRKWFQMMWESN